MTYLPTDRVEVPIGLIAQLSYYQESKNFNLIEMYNEILVVLAARKTISQMLMNDVQVNTIFDIQCFVINGTRKLI